MTVNNRLFFLSNAPFGGWVSFGYHLSKVCDINHVIKVKDTYKGGGCFYDNIQYRNIKPAAIKHFIRPIILAVDKAHYKYLKYFRAGVIVLHDPTELSEEVLEYAKRSEVITIRRTVSDLLNSMGVKNTFLKHPFFPYEKFKLPKVADRALSRLDFDKNTDIICAANNIGAKVEIYGHKNHLYYYHKLKQLGIDGYYKGYYPKEINAISKLYATTRYLVDLSTIKKDGGGTQYTFMEAEYHGCGLILHKDWCNVAHSIYKDGINCRAIQSPAELISALAEPPIMSNVLPKKADNDLWIQTINRR